MPISRHSNKKGCQCQPLSTIRFKLLIFSGAISILVLSCYQNANNFLTMIGDYGNTRGRSKTAIHLSSFMPSPLSICETLSSHMKGKWHHTHLQPGDLQQDVIPASNSLSTFKLYQYLPHELDWLTGLSDDWKGKTGCEKYRTDLRGYMYASGIGNQCGCGTKGFRPSDSRWIWNNSLESDKAGSTQQQHTQHHSPSFEMVQRLAKENKTMCFAGDSIDLQFYVALVNNVLRHRLFIRENYNDVKQNVPNISVKEHSIPVVYTNETTGPVDYAKYWMCMESIQETIVSITYDNGTAYSTALRYYKVYGWSPWNFIVMDNDCDVLIYTLGIHYDAHGEMIGKHYGNNKFVDDFRAAITFLTEFNARNGDNVAIWRSILPQHFDTVLGDGHYPPKNSVNGTCTAFDLLDSSSSSNGTNASIQNFNRIAEEGFSQICQETVPSCHDNTFQYNCAMNVTSTSYRTIYNHFIDNNLTSKADELKSQYPGGTVEGSILYWDIASLFNVAEWHHDDGDCSHFCYVPNLYEEAFRRLDWLLL